MKIIHLADDFPAPSPFLFPLHKHKQSLFSYINLLLIVLFITEILPGEFLRS